MAMAAVGLKIAFLVLECVITATVIYTIATDRIPFREEFYTPWMAATWINFYITTFPIGLWIIYKESSWIHSVIWIIPLICFGSITTCGYIVLQLLKLSPQEAIHDPIYFVLLSNNKKNERKSKNSLSVTSARILFGALGFLMLGMLICIIATHESPFRKGTLTPWMWTTMVDFYISVVALSVWVAYKEPSWKTATVWIILFICFGSISTCAYIVLQLFRLSPQDPILLLLFSNDNKSHQA